MIRVHTLYFLYMHYLKTGWRKEKKMSHTESEISGLSWREKYIIEFIHSGGFLSFVSLPSCKLGVSRFLNSQNMDRSWNKNCTGGNYIFFHSISNPLSSNNIYSKVLNPIQSFFCRYSRPGHWWREIQQRRRQNWPILNLPISAEASREHEVHLCAGGED